MRTRGDSRALTETAAPPRRGPRRYAKSAQTRRRILDAAIAVFAKHGFVAGTMAEIAEHAAVSEAQVYYHFSNKATLLGGVLEARDLLADELAGPEPEEAADIPSAVLRIAADNESVPDFIRLYMVLFAEATTPDHPAEHHFRDRYRRLRDEFAAAFSRMEAEGLLKPGVTVETAALSTLAMWDGIQLQWLLEPERIDVVGLLRAHLGSLTHMR